MEYHGCPDREPFHIAQSHVVWPWAGKGLGIHSLAIDPDSNQTIMPKPDPASFSSGQSHLSMSLRLQLKPLDWRALL
jgi:hypothetical protein